MSEWTDRQKDEEWMMGCIQKLTTAFFLCSIQRSIGTRQNWTDRCPHTHTQFLFLESNKRCTSHMQTHLQFTIRLPLLSQCSAHCLCSHNFLPRCPPLSLLLSLSLFSFFPSLFHCLPLCFCPVWLAVTWPTANLLSVFFCLFVVQWLFCRAAVCSLLRVLVVLLLQPHRFVCTLSSSCLTFVSDASHESWGSAAPPTNTQASPPKFLRDGTLRFYIAVTTLKE